VRRLDAEALSQGGLSFNVNFILGGQIGERPPEIYQIYPEGNAIHASRESPFLQIGELKYGKPILDRGFTYDTPLLRPLNMACFPWIPRPRAMSRWARPLSCFATAPTAWRRGIA